MLTLKDKLELFNLAKKPRKQIRLRLEVITNSLNLPSLHKTLKFISEGSSQKHQKAVMNTNNFKKIDKTKHNITTVCRTQENETIQNQPHSQKPNFRHSVRDKQNPSKSISGKKMLAGNQKARQKSSRLYHPNNNTEFLLKDFNFYMTRGQKQDEMQQDRMFKARQNYSYLFKERTEHSCELVKLKNQFNGLKNMNKIYKAQLENGKRIQKIALNANRLSQLLLEDDKN